MNNGQNGSSLILSVIQPVTIDTMLNYNGPFKKELRVNKALREESSQVITVPGPPPLEIIFSNRHEIRRLNVSEKSYVSLVSGLRNTIALDFYYNKSSANTTSPGDGSQVFWTDVVDDKIYAGTMIASCK